MAAIYRRSRGALRGGAQEVLKWGSILACRLSTAEAGPKTRILMYHRIGAGSDLELDIPRAVFRGHLEYLRDHYPVISVTEWIASLNQGREEQEDRVVLTFDDAFSDFTSQALPLLEEFAMPATLFVPTGFIDDPEQIPLTVPADGSLDWNPITWDQVRELAAHPLVTLGAHTHGHLRLAYLNNDVVKADLEESHRHWLREVGKVPSLFAYPGGSNSPIVQKIVSEYYPFAFLASGGAQSLANFHPHMIRRIPIRRSDGTQWFSMRIRGALMFEESVMSILHSSRVRMKSLCRLHDVT